MNMTPQDATDEGLQTHEPGALDPLVTETREREREREREQNRNSQLTLQSNPHEPGFVSWHVTRSMVH